MSRKWSSVVRGWGDQLLGDTDLRLAFKPLSDMVGGGPFNQQPGQWGAFDERGTLIHEEISLPWRTLFPPFVK